MTWLAGGAFTSHTPDRCASIGSNTARHSHWCGPSRNPETPIVGGGQAALDLHMLELERGQGAAQLLCRFRAN